MKRKYDLCFFIFGVVLTVTGLILLQNHNASAASQSYSEDYTVTKWRNFDFYDKTLSLPPGSPGKTVSVSIGPSQWNVTGTIGSTTYSEVWNATSWKDNASIPYMTMPNNSSSFSDSDTYSPGACISTGGYFCVKASGLYGAILTVFPSGSADKTALTSSLPEKWHVTGTINTP